MVCIHFPRTVNKVWNQRVSLIKNFSGEHGESLCLQSHRLILLRRPLCTPRQSAAMLRTITTDQLSWIPHIHHPPPTNHPTHSPVSGSSAPGPNCVPNSPSPSGIWMSRSLGAPPAPPPPSQAHFRPVDSGPLFLAPSAWFPEVTRHLGAWEPQLWPSTS